MTNAFRALLAMSASVEEAEIHGDVPRKALPVSYRKKNTFGQGIARWRLPATSLHPPKMHNPVATGRALNHEGFKKGETLFHGSTDLGGGVHHNSCGVKNMDQLIGQIEETRAEVGGYIAKNPNISTTQDSMNLTTMGPQPKQATTSVTREHVNAANTSSDSKI